MILGNSGESGFTLTELLIGIVLSGIVIAGVYGFFVSQIKTYSLQEQLVEMQENARIAIDTIVMGLQNAGYDPTNSPFGFGITSSDFSSRCSALPLTTSNELYFTVDEVQESPTSIIANNDTERFGFKLDSSGSLVAAAISGSDGSITGWDPIADNIDVLSFTYTYADGNTSSGTNDLPSNIVVGRKFDDIRKVTISLTAKTNQIDPNYVGDGFRRLTLTAEVSPRNLVPPFGISCS
ncbi:MAG: prepilin-type N-terminal cleavage/methylation domain-containing protein [Deltaproteobacteria bacterium]|nr:prepilin-type N-terminal cleavage/methylation domain-containing protein [Deltaproteobacteria bacterium]